MQFIGPSNWISPTHRGAINDGTRFELNEHWLANNRRKHFIPEDDELI